MLSILWEKKVVLLSLIALTVVSMVGCKGISDAGADGLAIVQGDAGIQGDTGLQDAAGPQGEVGVKGEPGFRGHTGDTGPAGSPGPRGEAGPKGDVGPPGSVAALTFYSVEVRGTVPDARIGVITAPCNPGDVVTGGGYHITSAVAYQAQIQSSTPQGDSGWSAKMLNRSGGFETVAVTVHARCMVVP